MGLQHISQIERMEEGWQHHQHFNVIEKSIFASHIKWPAEVNDTSSPP